MHAIPVFLALLVFGIGFGIGQRIFKTEDSRLWGGALIGGGAMFAVAAVLGALWVYGAYFSKGV